MDTFDSLSKHFHLILIEKSSPNEKSFWEMSLSELLYDVHLFLSLINPNIYLLLTLVVIVHACLFGSSKSETKLCCLFGTSELDLLILAVYFS